MAKLAVTPMLLTRRSYVMLGLHRIVTILVPIYELKNYEFLDSWAVVELSSLASVYTDAGERLTYE